MRVYLDHNATTPLAPRSSTPWRGALRDASATRRASTTSVSRPRRRWTTARGQVAALIGAEPTEVVFTGGGTETDNLAMRGAAEALEPTGRRHLIASAIEHEAVLNTLQGARPARLDVTRSCRSMRAASSRSIALREAHHRRHGARLGDARQQRDRHHPADRGAGRDRARAAARCSTPTPCSRSARFPSTCAALGVDLLSLSAHKFYGPKGAGALWMRARRAADRRTMTGGKQERNRRAGTENVPALVGLGVAAARCRAEARRRSGRGWPRCAIGSRRGILAAVPGTARQRRARSPRVPNTTNISFDRVEAESLLIALDLEGIAVSTGSACSSGTLEPSHVLQAMGLRRTRTQNSIRFSLGLRRPPRRTSTRVIERAAAARRETAHA